MNTSGELSYDKEETLALFDAVLAQTDLTEAARLANDLQSKGNIGVLNEHLSRLSEDEQSRIRALFAAAQDQDGQPGYTTSEQ